MSKRTNMGIKLTHLVVTPFAFEKVAAPPAVRNLSLCKCPLLAESGRLKHDLKRVKSFVD